MKENIEYRILHQPDQAIFDLLRKTVYGTKGVKIIHCDTDKKLKELHQPDFHTLWQGKKLLAVAAYCKREIQNHNDNISAYYIRYFSVSPEHQGKGLGKLLTEQIEKHYRSSIGNKTIFYAYIENQNVKSSGVSKHFEMKNIGKFTTIFFSRFFPRKNKHCSRVSKSEILQIKKLLQEEYKNFATVFFNRIGYENGYYIFKENGKIIAGVQGINTTWKMKKIPGIIGWLTLHIFPYIPFIKRIANGKDFQFIGFEGIYYQPGRIDAFLQLIEHVLSDNKIYKGFLYFDTKNKILPELKESKKLGLLNKIQKSPIVSISNQALFFSQEEQEELERLPKYISAYDIT